MDEQKNPKLGRDPLRIFCKNCGAPAEYDIPTKTYCCAYCGETSGLREVKEGFENWRRLRKQNHEVLRTEEELCTCTGCGARVLFPAGEASETCTFCSGKLVRQEFEEQEQFPEMIIPFSLTKKAATKCLQDWVEANKDTPEAAKLKPKIRRLGGWYLPYQLVRGPVDVQVRRIATVRPYTCDGFLEGTAVSTSEQLNNLVMNGAEPFDWSELVPFEHGYIAGHKVKLNDLSEADTEARVMAETEADYLPSVEKVMQTRGLELNMESGDLMNLPVLLPFYLVQADNLLAVVNGQTGRVSVTIGREVQRHKWWLEPLISSLIIFLIPLFWFRSFMLAGMIVVIPAMILFAAFSNGAKKKKDLVVLSSPIPEKPKESGERLQKTFSNLPVFYEMDGDKRVPVEMKFYTPVRILGMILRVVVIELLPAILVFFIRLIGSGGKMGVMEILSGIPLNILAGWAIVAAMFSLIYWIIGVRGTVYNHPILYAVEPDGSRRLIGTRASRRMSLLAGIWSVRKEVPKEWWGVVLGTIALAAGAVVAMLF